MQQERKQHKYYYRFISAITLFWYFISVFEKEKLTLWLRLLPMKERQHKEFLLLAVSEYKDFFRKRILGNKQ